MKKSIHHSLTAAGYLKIGLPFILEQCNHGPLICFYSAPTHDKNNALDTVAVFIVKPKAY